MNDKHPTISGDFDSTEMSELQTEFADMVKMVCKVALNISESPISVRVERPDGLQIYMRKVQEAVDKGHPLDREEMDELAKDVRYHDITDKLGNRTEMIRLIVSRLASKTQFKEVADKMIDEALLLSHQRKNQRHFAEKTQSEDLGT